MLNPVRCRVAVMGRERDRRRPGHDSASLLHVALSALLTVNAWGVSLHPHARVVASTSHSGSLFLWSTETGERLRDIPASRDFVTTTAFVRDSAVSCA